MVDRFERTGASPRGLGVWLRCNGPLIAAAALYLLWYALRAPHGPVLTRDSDTYITYAPIRTAGYPLVLNILPQIAVVWLQPLVFAVALAFAGGAIRRLTGSYAWALLGMGIACLYPDVARFHSEIMTESLVMSFMLGLVSAAAFLCLRPTAPLALGVSMTAGCLIVLRPSCIILVPVVALLALIARVTAPPPRSWALLLVALLAPMLALFAADRIADKVVHGAQATSLAGRHAFAKAALLPRPGGTFAPGSDVGRMAQALSADYAPMRAAIAAPSNREVARLVRNAYENCLPWRCQAPARARVSGTDAQINRVALAAAMDRIKHNPLDFLRLEISDDIALWRPGALDAPHTAKAYNTFIAAHRPMPMESAWPLLVKPVKPSTLALVRSLAVAAAGLATLGLVIVGGGLAIAGRPVAPDLGAAVFAALSAQAVVGFSALAAPPEHRFTTALWPVLVFSVLLAGHGLLRIALAARAAAATGPSRPSPPAAWDA